MGVFVELAVSQPVVHLAFPVVGTALPHAPLVGITGLSDPSLPGNRLPGCQQQQGACWVAEYFGGEWAICFGLEGCLIGSKSG